MGARPVCLHPLVRGCQVILSEVTRSESRQARLHVVRLGARAPSSGKLLNATFFRSLPSARQCDPRYTRSQCVCKKMRLAQRVQEGELLTLQVLNELQPMFPHGALAHMLSRFAWRSAEADSFTAAGTTTHRTPHPMSTGDDGERCLMCAHERVHGGVRVDIIEDLRGHAFSTS